MSWRPTEKQWRKTLRRLRTYASDQRHPGSIFIRRFRLSKTATSFANQMSWSFRNQKTYNQFPICDKRRSKKGWLRNLAQMPKKILTGSISATPISELQWSERRRSSDTKMNYVWVTDRIRKSPKNWRCVRKCRVLQSTVGLRCWETFATAVKLA